MLRTSSLVSTIGRPVLVSCGQASTNSALAPCQLSRGELISGAKRPSGVSTPAMNSSATASMMPEPADARGEDRPFAQ